MAVDQDDEYRINLSQERYVLNILDKYVPTWKSTAKVRNHPQSELYSKLCKPANDTERSKAASLPYMNIVGALLFVSVMTRPRYCISHVDAC